MSWHPNDLVTDADLRDYEASILTSFGETTWLAKRTKALEDWLFPILTGRGFDPFRLITRAEVDVAYGHTGSVYTDVTSKVRDTPPDDVDLATVFATPASDALYLGSSRPFRGVFVRIEDSPSTVSSGLSVAYWAGTWTPLLVADGTQDVAGKTLSGGGSVTWLLPMDWTTRAVNNSTRLYWVKVTVSATPTGAKTGQISTIRASALRPPATFRTLELIFREAPIQEQGPWDAKADYYAAQANEALQRALPLVGAEFDSDASDQISETESGQTSDEATGGGWVLERA
jgi:hypothetical protein